MSGEPKMFRINPENRDSEAITEVEFSRLGFQERRDIQEMRLTFGAQTSNSGMKVTT